MGRARAGNTGAVARETAGSGPQQSEPQRQSGPESSGKGLLSTIPLNSDTFPLWEEQLAPVVSLTFPLTGKWACTRLGGEGTWSRLTCAALTRRTCRPLHHFVLEPV